MRENKSGKRVTIRKVRERDGERVREGMHWEYKVYYYSVYT